MPRKPADRRIRGELLVDLRLENMIWEKFKSFRQRRIRFCLVASDHKIDGGQRFNGQRFNYEFKCLKVESLRLWVAAIVYDILQIILKFLSFFIRSFFELWTF